MSATRTHFPARLSEVSAPQPLMPRSAAKMAKRCPTGDLSIQRRFLQGTDLGKEKKPKPNQPSLATAQLTPVRHRRHATPRRHDMRRRMQPFSDRNHWRKGNAKHHPIPRAPCRRRQKIRKSWAGYPFRRYPQNLYPAQPSLPNGDPTAILTTVPQAFLQFKNKSGTKPS